MSANKLNERPIDAKRIPLSVSCLRAFPLKSHLTSTTLGLADIWHSRTTWLPTDASPLASPELWRIVRFSIGMTVNRANQMSEQIELKSNTENCFQLFMYQCFSDVEILCSCASAKGSHNAHNTLNLFFIFTSDQLKTSSDPNPFQYWLGTDFFYNSCLLCK